MWITWSNWYCQAITMTQWWKKLKITLKNTMSCFYNPYITSVPPWSKSLSIIEWCMWISRSNGYCQAITMTQWWKKLRPSPKNTRGREMLLLVWLRVMHNRKWRDGRGTGCSLEDVEGAQQLAADNVDGGCCLCATTSASAVINRPSVTQ